MAGTSGIAHGATNEGPYVVATSDISDDEIVRVAETVDINLLAENADLHGTFACTVKKATCDNKKFGPPRSDTDMLELSKLQYVLFLKGFFFQVYILSGSFGVILRFFL